MRPRLRGPIARLGALVVLLMAAVAYSLGARHLALPAELQYVPTESELIVASGDVGSVWEAVALHFGAMIREQAPTGVIGPLVADADKTLREHKVVLRAPADLIMYGVDSRHGVVFAADRLDGNPAILVVVHVTDPDKFQSSLAAVLELPVRPEAVEVPAPGRAVALGQSGPELWIAYPERGVAVIATALPLLRRALLERRDNLAYFRADDRLYEAARRRQHWRMLVGPEVLFSWRPLNNSLVTRATGLLGLYPDRLRFEADVDLVTRGVRALDELLVLGHLDDKWTGPVGSEAALTLALQHPSASRFLPLIADTIGADPSDAGIGGVLRQLASIPDLRQIAIVVPRYREGLPDVFLGIWADPERIRTLAADLQRELRAARDELVLSAAADEYCSQRDKATCGPTVEDLRQVHLLVPEPHQRFERYGIQAGVVRRVMTQNAAPPEIARTYRETWPLTELAPAITPNDIRYRPSLADADPATLNSGRYRLVATVATGVLWIATEEQDLTAFLDRTHDRRDGLAASPLFRAASAGWTSADHLQAFINTDRTTMIALRSGEKSLSDTARDYLSDFRNHPVLTVEVTPVDGGRRVRVGAWALRWLALSTS